MRLGVCVRLSLSNPEPRPAEMIDPSSLASCCGFMGTTLASRRENIRVHWDSRICSPWYDRAVDLAVHFCWKNVLLAVGGARNRCRLYKLYLLHDCRIFCDSHSQLDEPFRVRCKQALTYSLAQRRCCPIPHGAGELMIDNSPQLWLRRHPAAAMRNLPKNIS